MNAEEQMKERMRTNMLETMKEISHKTRDVYWYYSAMKQLYGTKELTDEEAARLTEIQDDIDWLVGSYESRMVQQEQRRNER